VIPPDAIAQPGAFDRRHPDEQEAILLNIYCERCRRPAMTPVSVMEHSLGVETWIQATCMRCEGVGDINLRNLP
jgi:hypothetical protein